MGEVQKYIDQRKKTDLVFGDGFDEGYQELEIGVLIRQAREGAGLTQEQLADRIKSTKTAISRMENHARDIKLSTLQRVARALGKHIEVHMK